MGGGANGSSKLNDGAGLGTCKDCDGVRLGSGSERLGVGRTRLVAYLSGGVGEDSRLASAPAEVEAAAAQEHNYQYDDEYS
jgi:hypothetical protein